MQLDVHATKPNYQILEFSSAKDFWARLAPESPLAPPPAQFIYRGQADASWGLIPSALRKDSLVRDRVAEEERTAEVQTFFEMRLLQVYVETCDSVGLEVPGDCVALRDSLSSNTQSGGGFISAPSSWPTVEQVKLMAAAQHHGIPTRLLDWSRRAHVAAYFAASASFAMTRRGEKLSTLAVWAMDTTCLPEISPEKDRRPNGGGLYPKIELVPVPGSASANLAAQAGLFTLLRDGGQMRKKVSCNPAHEYQL